MSQNEDRKVTSLSEVATGGSFRDFFGAAG